MLGSPTDVCLDNTELSIKYNNSPLTCGLVRTPLELRHLVVAGYLSHLPPPVWPGVRIGPQYALLDRKRRLKGPDCPHMLPTV